MTVRLRPDTTYYLANGNQRFADGRFGFRVAAHLCVDAQKITPGSDVSKRDLPSIGVDVPPLRVPGVGQGIPRHEHFLPGFRDQMNGRVDLPRLLRPAVVVELGKQ